MPQLRRRIGEFAEDHFGRQHPVRAQNLAPKPGRGIGDEGEGNGVPDKGGQQGGKDIAADHPGDARGGQKVETVQGREGDEGPRCHPAPDPVRLIGQPAHPVQHILRRPQPAAAGIDHLGGDLGIAARFSALEHRGGGQVTTGYGRSSTRRQGASSGRSRRVTCATSDSASSAVSRACSWSTPCSSTSICRR